MNAKLIRTLFSMIAVLALVGCSDMTLSNLTPQRVPQNPSGIYTITMKPSLRDATIIQDSIMPYIVIDGTKHPMKKSSMGANIFEYEYTMPAGHADAKYYFVIDYLADVKGTPRERSETSELYTLKLINRYVVTMVTERGPVGSKVAVVGRGFSKYDKVTIGGIEADTTVESSNALSFIVPALPAGRSYQAYLRSGNGNMPIGQFLIDAGNIRVMPKELTLTSGERSVLIFSIDNPAPKDGLLIDVTTDIPESVIMPEVIIPGGARSVSIPLEGGLAGNGTLYATASGFGETHVPISVIGEETSEELTTFTETEEVEYVRIEATEERPSAPLNEISAPASEPTEVSVEEFSQIQETTLYTPGDDHSLSSTQEDPESDSIAF